MITTTSFTSTTSASTTSTSTSTRSGLAENYVLIAKLSSENMRLVGEVARLEASIEQVSILLLLLQLPLPHPLPPPQASSSKNLTSPHVYSWIPGLS